MFVLIYLSIQDTSHLLVTVSTPNVWNRFKKLNKGKLWKEIVKPFNFCLVEFQAVEENGRGIIPLALFCDNQSKNLNFVDSPLF